MLNADIHVHHVVLTACFLISMTSCSTLENKTFISCSSLDVLCFVHDVSTTLDKLSTRAIKCVFWGYSCLSEGYKRYSPKNKSYCMSTKVTFFENIPFSLSFVQDTNSNVILQKIKTTCLLKLHSLKIYLSPHLL